MKKIVVFKDGQVVEMGSGITIEISDNPHILTTLVEDSEVEEVKAVLKDKDNIDKLTKHTKIIQ